ncbi:hypothetical protein TNCV_4855431 [Trichonephila clavipes]|nr:hypothetical protein TNCV_4855431 [Trichonephila clavipes]
MTLKNALNLQHPLKRKKLQNHPAVPHPKIKIREFPPWGHDGTNSRGRQIQQLISDHCLCLLSNDEKTYFHASTRTFHSLDLVICSPNLLPLLKFEVDSNLHNIDHFPLLVSHVNDTATSHRPPTYNFHSADWDKFTRQSVITEELVLCRGVDDAVLKVTDAVMKAADAGIPKTSNYHRKQ